jgi:hypothetical protein
VIDEGVYFEGNCKMGANAAAGTSTSTSQTREVTDHSKDSNWARKDEKRPEPVGITR